MKIGDFDLEKDGTFIIAELSANHGGKIEIKGLDLGDENSIYSQWSMGHGIHGSVWGASNQFLVVPGLDRKYTFRWLNKVGSRTSLQFLYVKENENKVLVSFSEELYKEELLDSI